MRGRIISVSAAPYDGYPFPTVLESLASCGAEYVEPIFITGYTDSFDETAFSSQKAQQYAAWLADAGLRCHAFSSHMDLGEAQSVEIFRGRLEFAARIGAKVINTTAAARSHATLFYRNIELLGRHAESLGMTIGLENPGDGSDNVYNSARDGIALLQALGLDSLKLNYDAGNTVSHRPRRNGSGLDPVAEALLALPHSCHAHIKDVRATEEGYFFVPIGQGDVGCEAILQAMAATSLDLSIETPLRFHRLPNGQPLRRPEPVPLADIEAVIKASLQFVQQRLGTRMSELAGV